MPLQEPSIQSTVSALLDESEPEDESKRDAQVAALRASAGISQVVAEVGNYLETAELDADTRLRAVQLLLDLGHVAATPFIGQALINDGDERIRRVALKTLETIDPIEGIGYFQQAANKHADLKNEAIASIGISLQRIAEKLEQNRESEAEKNRLEAYFRLVNRTTLETLLVRPVTLTEVNQDPFLIPQAAVIALTTVFPKDSVEPLCDYLLTWVREQQDAEQRSEELDQSPVQDPGKPRVAVTIIQRLGELKDPSTIPCLSKTLNDSLQPEVRRQAARALIQLTSDKPDDEAVCSLTKALIKEPKRDIRVYIASQLKKNVDSWQTKADCVIQVLANDPTQQRTVIDESLILEAIAPAGESSIILTDHLIGKVEPYGNDSRIVAILAALIISSTGGSRKQAAERINHVQKEKKIQEAVIQPLRLEMGGEAFQPYLDLLSAQLEQDFLGPIRSLNADTSKTWQRTISIAYIGFVLRTMMSVILFFIGMYLVIYSFNALLTDQLNSERLFGPGVSFIAGLGTMLTMVFFGPLKEIRKSVSDVGASSAIFIAYIHSILQVSHTFSAFYRRGEMTFVELKESANLVESAMRAAMAELNRRDTKGNDSDQVAPPISVNPTSSPNPADN
jgi:HEAT repeat protein